MFNRFALATAAALLFAGCSQQDVTGPAGPGVPPRLSADFLLPPGGPGAVYTESNAAAGNAILAFTRSAAGALTAAGSFPTGGLGTGADLGSEGAVTLIDHQWLLAVNAGSNEVSVFRIAGNGLVRTDRVPSGGAMPVFMVF